MKSRLLGIVPAAVFYGYITGAIKMKKKALAWLATGSFMFGITGMVGASPVLYTFQGEVTKLLDDSAGYLSNSNITLGTVFSYTFLVDFDMPGTAERYNGETTTFVDDYMGNGLDYFYADFLSESILTPDYDLAFTNPSDPNISEYNVGYRNLSNPILGYTAQLFGGSTSHFIEFQTPESDPFSIGTAWMYNEVIHLAADAADDDMDGFNATMMLTQISSVPAPPAVWLFGSGLLTLVGAAKRKAA